MVARMTICVGTKGVWEIASVLARQLGHAHIASCILSLVATASGSLGGVEYKHI
jgi:hypothetical protein